MFVAVSRPSGTSWVCCTPTPIDALYPACGPATAGGCNATYNELYQCIRINQAIGCGANSAPPCGEYVGPKGLLGVQVYQGGGLASLNLTTIGNGVLLNWPRIGYDNAVSLCCSSAACRLLSVTSVAVNVCNADEYMLKCAGDNLHGICSIWTDADIGEYLLVNADTQAPASSWYPTYAASHFSFPSRSRNNNLSASVARQLPRRQLPHNQPLLRAARNWQHPALSLARSLQSQPLFSLVSS
jgi:hypothetical protein